jgi:hypothetical protein
MSCFWDGLIKALRNKNIITKDITPNRLLYIVKIHNKRFNNILVNNEKISRKQKEEHILRVQEIKQTNNGYLCSAFDPVLILICGIYRVNIIHHYNGATINYTKKNNTNTIIVHSNQSHFWAS